MKKTIALAGNPNSGKTTLFNELTGANQYVGNWPGVTVEKKEGPLRGNKDVAVVDLPGVYSLSPYSPEEVVSRDYLLGDEPDVILNIVDGTNMERNLYLSTQLLEVGLPAVIALNMLDLMNKNGDKVNTDKLAERLGCPVVLTSALKGKGTLEAANHAVNMAGNKPATGIRFGKSVEAALAKVAALIKDKTDANKLRWYSVKLFERDEKALRVISLSEEEKQKLEEIILPLEEELEDDSESIITSERYEFISSLIKECVYKKQQGFTTSDKIDRIVTNRWLALPIFIAVMFAVYFIAVSTVGTLVTDWTNDTLFGGWIAPAVQSWMGNANAAAWITSLVVDGIIGGVGAILGFVPQMIILFIFLSFLEDCGYMARIAFIMDRIFCKFGLSGKSFIPMLISSGCAVPGIMATKTIENEKDRRMTIITTSFIPCGAKLPIIALLGGALFGDKNTWWLAPVMYFVGVLAVILSGVILKKTKMFAGDPAPFVMELPQYHLPAFKSLVLHVWERVKSFVIKAGTIIFASSIAIWFLLAFGTENGSFGMVEGVENSILAKIGGAIAFIFKPLGFGSWQATVATLSGLVAKENLVSTLGVISGMSADAAGELIEDTKPLWGFINGMLPSLMATLSFLAFNMLCAPCFAAIGSISRQMASAKWTWFAIAYQTTLAYCISLMIYQFGSLFTGGGFTIGTAAAVIVLGGMLYMLLRKASKPNSNLKAVNV